MTDAPGDARRPDPPEGAVDLGADDADDLLRDARAFVAGEASLLAGLGGVLDELAAAEEAEADAFDTDAMWARVRAQLWPDDGAEAGGAGGGSRDVGEQPPAGS